MCEPDPYAACSLIEQGARDFAESQDMPRLSLAWGYVAATRMFLGDHASAEAAGRRGLAVAEQLQDSYLASVARHWLSYALCDQMNPDGLDEAEQCARSLLEAHLTPVWDAMARLLFARVAIARGEWARVASESQKAQEQVVAMRPIWFVASTYLTRARVRQGRREEAAAVAREGLHLLSQTGGTGYSEIPFRVAAAEALFAAGDREAAESALREALRQIDHRAAKISDAYLRDCFLHRREENLRALELAGAWFGGARWRRDVQPL
jgi:tetratricopeptide (TPR) repeat protein